MAEVVDARGRVLARGEAAVTRRVRPRHVASALRRVGTEVAGQAPSPVRLAMVSAADPVDRASGRRCICPARRSCSASCPRPISWPARCSGPVVVDNDVNWAARAERDAAGQAGADVVLPVPWRGTGRRDRQRRRRAPGPRRHRRRDRARYHRRPGRHGHAVPGRVRRPRAAVPGSTAIDTGALETAIGDGTTAGPRRPRSAGPGHRRRVVQRSRALRSATRGTRRPVGRSPLGRRRRTRRRRRAQAAGRRARCRRDRARAAGRRPHGSVRALGDSIVNYRSTLAPTPTGAAPGTASW